jgi:hypothetical protein
LDAVPTKVVKQWNVMVSVKLFSDPSPVKKGRDSPVQPRFKRGAAKMEEKRRGKKMCVASSAL